MLAIACSEEAPPARPRPEPPPPPLPIAAPRALGGENAFAMAPTDDGAVLFFGAAYTEGGGLRAVPLGPHGEEVARDVVVWSPARADAAFPIVEVEAAAIGRRVGVAWIVDHGTRAVAYSSFSTDGGRTFAAASELGPSVTLARTLRGRLAIAANDDGELRMYQRIDDGPCVGEERGQSCARFVGRAVGGDLSTEERGVETREVARPCDPLVSGLRWHGGTRYVAICNRQNGEPRTTVFAIRSAIDWAAVTEVACAPSGIAPLDDGVIAFTECGAAYALDAMGAQTSRFDPPNRSIVCGEGRVELRVSSGSSARSLRLAEADDHLEALLPPSLAPAGARAIWTGESMLVALHVGRDVRVRRYECVRGDRFDRTDVR